MAEYKYIKLMDLEGFQGELEDSRLATLIEDVTVQSTLLTVTTTRELWGREEQLLRDMVLSHDPTVSGARNAQNSALDFGRQIIVEFGAEPSINGLDTLGTARLIETLAPIQMMLFSGALGTAIYMLQTVDLTGLVAPEIVSKYTGKLYNYVISQ